MNLSQRLFLLKKVLFLFSILWIPALSEAAALDQTSLRNPFKSLLPTIVKSKEPTQQDIRKQQAARPATALPAQVQPIPQLTVTGLVWNSNRPQAIVNGQVVNQGDTVVGVKIVRIHKRGIDVAFQGAATTIKP